MMIYTPTLNTDFSSPCLSSCRPPVFPSSVPIRRSGRSHHAHFPDPIVIPVPSQSKTASKVPHVPSLLCFRPWPEVGICLLSVHNP